MEEHFPKQLLLNTSNSPETEFYKKGNNLYNMNSAKEFTSNNDEVLVVEGYMDVINFTQILEFKMLLRT